MALVKSDFESADYDGPDVLKEDARVDCLEQAFDTVCRAAEVAALQQSALQHAVSSCLASCLDCLDLLYVNREENPISNIALEHDSWRQEAEPEPCSKDSWLRGAIPEIVPLPSQQQPTPTTSVGNQTPLLAARNSRVRERKSVSKQDPGSVSSDVGRNEASNVAHLTQQPPGMGHTSSTSGIPISTMQQQQQQQQQEQNTQKETQQEPQHLLQGVGGKTIKTEQQEAQDRLRQELKLRRQQEAIVKELQQKDEQAHKALVAMHEELKGKEYTYDSKGKVVLLAPPQSLPVPPGPQFKLYTPPAAAADPAVAVTPSSRGASATSSTARPPTTTRKTTTSAHNRAGKGAGAAASSQKEFVPTASATQPPLLETLKPAPGVLVKAGASIKQGPKRDAAAQPTRSQYQQQAKIQTQQAARSTAAAKAADATSLGRGSRLSSTGSSTLAAGAGSGGNAVLAAVARGVPGANGASTGCAAGNTSSSSRLAAVTETGEAVGAALGFGITEAAAPAQPARSGGAAFATSLTAAAAAAYANVGVGVANQAGMLSAATAAVNLRLLGAEDWGVASAGTSYSPPELSTPAPANLQQVWEECELESCSGSCGRQLTDTPNTQPLYISRIWQKLQFAVIFQQCLVIMLLILTLLYLQLPCGVLTDSCVAFLLLCHVTDAVGW
jgi:hypothetical protein